MAINVLRGNVYIEHHVESGATVNHTYYGTVYKTGKEKDIEDDDSADKVKAEPVISDNDKKISAIIMAINIMASEEQFVHKKDFAAVLRMVREMEIFEKITIETFVGFTEKCDILQNLRPTKGAITFMTISKAKHPNWRIDGADVDETKRIVDIGSRFKMLYSQYVS